MTAPNPTPTPAGPTPAKPRFRIPDFDSRQITVGILSGLSYLLFVAIPTALIPTPVFGREIPPPGGPGPPSSSRACAGPP